MYASQNKQLLFLYTPLTHWFLGAFANLRKFTISPVMPVRPSVRNNSAPTGQIFMKFDIWVFTKICRANSSFIKIWQEWRDTLREYLWTLYMNTCGQFTWIPVDNSHEYLWTLYMNTCGQFTWIPVDTLHEYLWTLYMNTCGHLW